MKADTPTDKQYTVAALVREGRALLSQAAVANADAEALWLLEAALGCSRLALLVEGQREVTAQQWARAVRLLSRRAAREPLQYILGSQEFCGREFTVNSDVLIPRPETQGLVEEVVQACLSISRPVIADIGTGSGCIAVCVALALPGALVYATDLSPAAVALAQRNAQRHGVHHRMKFLAGDLCDPLRSAGLHGHLTAIVSNPPYIGESDFAALQPEVRCFEPRIALAGGVDGGDFHRRLVSDAAELLMPGGLLAMEVGAGQAGRLKQWAMNCPSYDQVLIKSDEAGIERVLCLRRAA